MRVQSRSSIATLAGALGLGLALYLSALKFFTLPCAGGFDCGVVIHSRYGALLGVPVGLYAAVLWLVALFANSRWRLTALIVLGAGSVVFVAIQLFVLKHICPWCCAHSAVAWIALGFCRRKPMGWIALALGMILSGAGYTAGRHAVLQSVEAVKSAEMLLAVNNTAADWLGPVGPSSPALVLSLTCPKCLDLLDQLAAQDLSAQKNGPAIFLKSDAANHDLTVAFAAAVAHQGSGRDAFFTVSGLLLSQIDLVLGNPTGAATWLRSIFPATDAERVAAEQIVSAQSIALQAAGIATTPLLVPRNAPATIDFTIKDLFPSAP